MEQQRPWDFLLKSFPTSFSGNGKNTKFSKVSGPNPEHSWQHYAMQLQLIGWIVKQTEIHILRCCRTSKTVLSYLLVISKTKKYLQAQEIWLSRASMAIHVQLVSCERTQNTRIQLFLPNRHPRFCEQNTQQMDKEKQ